MKKILFIVIPILISILTSCEYLVFPIHPEDSIEKVSLPRGDYEVEYEELELVLDGSRRTVAVYTPVRGGDTSEEDWFLWSMGVNNRIYFHGQWLESLASHGITVVAMQPKDILFLDFNHLGRIVDENSALISMMLEGCLDGRKFKAEGMVGGFSIGASIAAFIAAENTVFSRMLLWAPSPSPYWTGVKPESLKKVTADVMIIAGELDYVAPPEDWPSEIAGLLRGKEEFVVIEDGCISISWSPLLLMSGIRRLPRPEHGSTHM